MQDGLHVEQTLYEMSASSPVVSTNITYDPLLPRTYVQACIESLLQALKDLVERQAV